MGIQRHEELKTKIDNIVQAGVSTLLIMDESGTGKELIDRYVHYLLHGDCSAGYAPLVRIKCCALLESLLEAELLPKEIVNQSGSAGPQSDGGLSSPRVRCRLRNSRKTSLCRRSRGRGTIRRWRQNFSVSATIPSDITSRSSALYSHVKTTDLREQGIDERRIGGGLVH